MVEELGKRGRTEDQIRAITETVANLIVSSAAGAGKTTVLVDRFIYLVTAAEPRSEVDEILAVTYTEAAAAQLRARVGDALRELWRDSGGQRLARQILLLDRASISTVHSFCLNVVRQNFHRLGLDPAFTVLDENEAATLRNECLEDLFELRYGDEKAHLFRDLVSRYGGKGMDEDLKEVVLKIHEFAHTIPDPEAWIRTWCDAGDESGCADRQAFVWKEQLGRFMGSELRCLLAAYERARAVLPADGSAAKLRRYVEQIEEATRSWLGMLEDGDLDSTLEAVGGFEKVKRPSPPKVQAEWKEVWAKAIEVADRALKDLRSPLAGKSRVELQREIEETASVAAQVLDLVRQFNEVYAEAKTNRAVLDFNDLERKCLELLWDPQSNGPSGIALALRDRFTHVLVDEYQDTNRVQDKIFSLVSRQGDDGRSPNFFAVGDVKQSIYRFRQADPEVFLERYGRSSATGAGVDHRIDLPRNFRSRRGIIEAVNAVFERLMTGGDSEILYDECARLQYGAGYSDGVGGGPTARDPLPVEVHFLPKAVDLEETPEGQEEVEDWEDVEREAGFVAKRILDLLDEGMQVWDEDLKRYRDLAYSDVVILLRAPRGKASTYCDVLHGAGIPVYAEPATGYFTSTEIQDFLSLLRIIDNPNQDIALGAVLRSPIVGLSEEELVGIRLADRSADFYSALLRYAADGENAALRDRLRSFLAGLDRWRSLARRGPLADLVWALYSETDYPAYVIGLENGSQRHANLIDLHDRARQFDRFKTQGLRRFLAFIDRLLETEGDVGQAPAQSQAENTVRILSIHKSKGLEFPVVVLPDLAKQFNEKDLNRQILFDREMGVACAVVDPARWIRYPSLLMRMIRERLRSRLLAEELRILYVAMTRAREHLILSAVVDVGKDTQRWTKLAGEISFGKAKTVLDWLGPLVAEMPDGRTAFDRATGNLDGERFSVRIHSPEEVAECLMGLGYRRKGTSALETISALGPLGAGGERAQARVVVDRLRWRYPWARATAVRGKEGVTEIKRRLNPWEEDAVRDAHWMRVFEERPSFVCKKVLGLNARERGLATHTVMEHLDLTGELDEAGIRAQMDDMVSRQILTGDEKEGVDPRGIAAWFRSDLGRRMLDSRDSVLREVPFTIRIPPSELHRDWGVESGEEFVVVQGVIDTLFLEGDGYILVDYKTDRVAPEEVTVRVTEYGLQMRLYARAVRSILGKPVVAAYLFFLEPGTAAEVDLSGSGFLPA